MWRRWEPHPTVQVFCHSYPITKLQTSLWIPLGIMQGTTQDNDYIDLYCIEGGPHFTHNSEDILFWRCRHRNYMHVNIKKRKIKVQFRGWLKAEGCSMIEAACHVLSFAAQISHSRFLWLICTLDPHQCPCSRSVAKRLHENARLHCFCGG